MKTQTNFDWGKSISTSKEDIDLLYFEEKFRSTSKEDANLFIVKKNSDLHQGKM